MIILNNIYDILDERFEKVAMLNEELEKEAAKKILGQEHSVVYMEKSAYSQIIPQK